MAIDAATGLSPMAYNVGIIPFGAEDAATPPDLGVFIIPTTSDRGVVIVSGWRWFMATGDPVVLGEERRLGASPLVLPLSDAPEGRVADGVIVESDSGPYPTIAHFFASYAHDTVVWVITDMGLWRVHQDSVYLVRRY